jgi:hypothetical protein
MDKRTIRWIKQNYYVVLVCLFSILACMYTIYHVGEQIEERDAQWVNYINDSDCLSECLYRIDYQMPTGGMIDIHFNKTT